MYKKANLKTIILLLNVLLLGVFIGCSSSDDSDSSSQNPDDNNDGPENELPGDLSLLETYFSDPSEVRSSKETAVITDNLKRYIGSAVEGSEIYLNIYTFKDMSVAEALDRAAVRGVNVHVMVDSSRTEYWEDNEPAAKFLKESFESSSGSEVVGINNDISVNHHKHAAFSEVKLGDESIKNVVFSMSTNFTTGQYKKLQDAQVLGGNEGLYEVVVSNWETMKGFRQSGTGHEFERSSYTSDDGKVTFEFLPMRENGEWNGHHPFMDILDKVTDYENDTVRVGQSLWKSTKSQMKIVDRLMEMQKGGAQVEIILSRRSGFDSEIIRAMDKLADEGADVLFLSKNNYSAMHSKYMMIKGNWDGKDNKWVIAGSTNFTDNAVQRAYDLVTFIKYKKVYNNYEKNFKKIQKAYR